MQFRCSLPGFSATFTHQNALFRTCRLNVPVHGRCGERRSPKVQPLTRPGVEPRTSWLAVRNHTNCTNLPHMHTCTCTHTHLTFVVPLTGAPLLNSSLITSTWPSFDARCIAFRPFCRNKTIGPGCAKSG